MTAINKQNYEVYFLDHIEGRLSAAQTAALMHLLDVHPELREELEGLELVRLEPNDHIRFEAKASLKKPVFNATAQVNEENYEKFFVDAAEGELTHEETNDLNKFLAMNPRHQREYDLILQCRLQPDTNIVFTDKASLKKVIVVPFLPRRMYYGIAVAASLTLLIGLAFLFEPGKKQPTEVAKANIEIPSPESRSPRSQPHDLSPTPPAPSSQPLAPISKHQTSSPGLLHEQEKQEARKEIIRSREAINLSHLASVKAPEKLDFAFQPTISSDQRIYFSNYFNDIAMSQNIRYAEELADEPTAERLLAHGSAVVKEIFQPGEEDINILTAQIDLWQIADVGINGFARLTGADLEFRKKTDDEGKVISFAFESQSLQISRNLRRNK